MKRNAKFLRPESYFCSCVALGEERFVSPGYGIYLHLLTCSVLWNRNDLLRLRFRLWKSFGSSSGSGSGPRQYLAQFSNNENFLQNLNFLMSEAALFPRKLASNF